MLARDGMGHKAAWYVGNSSQELERRGMLPWGIIWAFVHLEVDAGMVKRKENVNSVGMGWHSVGMGWHSVGMGWHSVGMGWHSVGMGWNVHTVT